MFLDYQFLIACSSARLESMGIEHHALFETHVRFGTFNQVATNYQFHPDNAMVDGVAG